MLNTKYIRTTITLPEDILFELKKRAVRNKKTMKQLMTDGLKMYLYTPVQDVKTDGSKSDLVSLFGAWGKGESGKKTVARMRLAKEDQQREKYLSTIWKKS